jgi:3',5'-cyclic AMP phosphodiesterase CpdA
MIAKSTRGSEWRKWDLHIHTPASYDYDDKSITNEEFVNKIAEQKISAIAITDHHVIDINRIIDIQRLAKDKGIVVFPGIEILSDARGKDPIHIIGIFSEFSNMNYIWSQLKAKTNIHKVEGEGKNLNEIYCDLADTVKLIHELGGVVSIHAGKKTNSLENISHAIPQGDAQKTDIAGIVDIFEVGKEKDVEDYNKFVNPSIERSIGKKLPVIICSDNHDVKNYSIKQNCWIKADLSFNGLKQIIYEPESRVKVQTQRPEQKNDYQIIDSITFDNDEMGNQEIKLNPNLNTVIGGRSSGKSILISCIACLNDCGKEPKEPADYYKEYNKHVHSLIETASVKWADGSNEPRKIIYYSQSEISEKVRPDNYGISGINDLIETIVKKESNLSSQIQQYESFLIANRTDLNSKINDLCELKRQIDEKKSAIAEIGNKNGIVAEISKIESEIETIKNSITNYLTKEEDADYKKQKDDLSKFGNDCVNLESDENQIEIAKETELFTSIDSTLSNLSPLTHEKIEKFYNELKNSTKERWIKFIEEQKQEIEENRQKVLDKIHSIRNSELYKKGLSFNQSNELLSIKDELLQKELSKKNDIEKKESELQNAKKTLEEFQKNIWLGFKKYKEKSEELANQVAIERDKVKISAYSSLIYKPFFDCANNALNRRSKDAQKYDDYEERNPEEREMYIKDIFEGILEERLPLKQNFQQALVDLFTSCYYKISYDVTYDGDSFKTMSEGKKAFIVLRLLLDFDDSKCPIIIDQPEDDLDNRAIYEKLVAYIREQKTKRQIVLATHNPNVVVGADAELVIVANQHGADTPNQEGTKFEYYGNSIENSFKDETCSTILLRQGIREHICDILEGGNTAFQIRERKYGYKTTY